MDDADFRKAMDELSARKRGGKVCRACDGQRAKDGGEVCSKCQGSGIDSVCGKDAAGTGVDLVAK